MDLATLYVTEPGAVVTRRSGRIVVFNEDRRLASVPIMLLRNIVLFGPIGITTPAVHLLLQNDVSVAFLRSDGRVRGRLESPSATAIELRRAQLILSASPAACTEFAAACLHGKLANQRTLLVRRARQGTVEDGQLLRDAADRIGVLAHTLDSRASVPSLLGVEGAASAIYFRALRSTVGALTGFTHRDRYGQDVLNSAMNYCSALLREAVNGAVLAVGLDPYVSFLHTPMRGRPTLVFDLMEEFRPLLVEGVALAAVGLRMIAVAEELPEGAPPVTNTHKGRTQTLTRESCAALIERFQHRLATNASDRLHASAGTYRDVLFRQAATAAEWCRHPSNSYTPFLWR